MTFEKKSAGSSCSALVTSVIQVVSFALSLCSGGSNAMLIESMSYTVLYHRRNTNQ